MRLTDGRRGGGGRRCNLVYEKETSFSLYEYMRLNRGYWEGREKSSPISSINISIGSAAEW